MRVASFHLTFGKKVKTHIFKNVKPNVDSIFAVLNLSGVQKVSRFTFTEPASITSEMQKINWAVVGTSTDNHYG